MKPFSLQSIRHIYLIGIGGIGMNGLACLLQEKGYAVSGSDLTISAYLKPLIARGAAIHTGHHADNITTDIDLVCYSSAIKKDNPEILEAQRKGIPVIKRAELLALLTQEKTLITVAGSHGKTTTTALLSFVLQDLGYQPTVFIGGVSLNSGQIAWWGQRDIFIVEVDESDGSFLYFKPDYAIVTNIDKEHLDFYKDEDDIKRHFSQFVSSVKKLTIGCGDDTNTRSVLAEYPQTLRYGLATNNCAYAENIDYSYTGSVYDAVLTRRNKTVPKIHIPLLGSHNILNSLAVLTLLDQLGVDPEKVKESFHKFKGTKRRFQVKEVVDETIFIDDYAHHPSEIRATLSSASYFHRRVVAIFEPHRYSRFSALSEEFKHSFDQTDVVVVTDIYAASEQKSKDIDMPRFCDELQKHLKKPVYFIPSTEHAALAPIIKKGDIVVGLGAGRISEVLDDVIRRFKKIQSGN